MNDLINDTELAKKLDQECAIIEWRMLKPHYQRGALIIVQEGLDIISAGIQIASDNHAVIERWIADQSLIKPTPAQAADWEQHNTRFRSLVIAPFVLMQAASH